MWPALAKGGFWGQILKMSCWYGLILHNIGFKIMYETWQSLDNYIILWNLWLQLFWENLI
jgi:hypothetical protein